MVKTGERGRTAHKVCSLMRTGCRDRHSSTWACGQRTIYAVDCRRRETTVTAVPCILGSQTMGDFFQNLFSLGSQQLRYLNRRLKSSTYLIAEVVVHLAVSLISCVQILIFADRLCQRWFQCNGQGLQHVRQPERL